MKRMLGLVLAGGLLLGLATTSDAQMILSFGGRGPTVVAGQPYGYGNGYGAGNGFGYNAYAPAGSVYQSYNYASPYGYRSYTATTYVQPAVGYGYARPGYAPSYGAPAAAYYGRGYSGMGYAPTAGTYAPYGGYATPNTGYGFVNPGNYPRNTGMNFYGYGITGP